MSAFELTDALVPELRKEDIDFVALILPMVIVGHTGIMSATIKSM
jgi:2,3-bisphosphoglycerate-independent phosphoglycerate mutase